MKAFSKNLLLLLASGLLLLLSACQSKSSGEDGEKPGTGTLTVLTFNIRFDNPGDSLNAWPNRRPRVDAFLDSVAPDLIGLQEVLHSQLQELLAAHPAYEGYGVGREDGLEKGEYQPLLWRKERFEAADKGHFWLSETPDTPSKGWDAACERTAVWALLRDKVSGREYLVMNTHLDHMGETARIESARMLKSRALRLAEGRPIILTGDFNAGPDSSVIALIKASEGSDRPFIDSRDSALRTDDNLWTYHDFGRYPLDQRERIDYIFLSGFSGDEIVSQTIFDEEESDPAHVYLSDHYPVLLELNPAK